MSSRFTQTDRTNLGKGEPRDVSTSPRADPTVPEQDEESDRFGRVAGSLLAVIAVVGVAFHVWTAGAGPLPSFKQTSIHVLFGVLVCLLALGSGTGAKRPVRPAARRLDNAAIVVEAVVAVGATLYIWREFDRLVYELGYARPTSTDIVIGTLMVLVVFDAARRAMGYAFAVIGVVVVLYTLYGDRLPGVLSHSGTDFSTMIATFFSSPLGIYGSITATSANQIAIFVIFGALLMGLGGGDGFLKLALIAAGRRRGGPGKVAVLSSALFGMVNGSAVANTASTGSITIPMMKRYGFQPKFAAAVEATASTGGQWTPPIMGAAVFLMAQLLAMPYYAVALAAIIPAAIYYLSFWVTVHGEAGKSGLTGMDSADIPRLRSFIDELVILVPAVTALLTLILMAYPVRIAGFSATVVLLLSAAVVQLLWKRRSPKAFAKDLVRSCVAGAITVATIAVLVAGSQVVVAAVGTTGFALNVGSLIFSVATASVFIALVFAALINIILGLSLPTVPSYLIAIAITGPALIDLGAEPLAVHLFALYFAVIGGLTPPIGATVFVASAIAGSNWLSTSATALRIAAIAIVLPFVFVLRPELLLDGGPWEILTTSIVVALGGVLLALALSRYALRPMPLWESAALAGTAVLLFYPSPGLNLAGTVLTLAAAGYYFRLRRRDSNSNSLLGGHEFRADTDTHLERRET